MTINSNTPVQKCSDVERRPLDGAEALASELSKRGVSNIVSCATLRSAIPLSQESLRQAVAMVVQCQPMLRASIVESTDKSQKFFECANKPSKILLNIIDRSADDCVHVVEELMESTKFKDEWPLWKVFLLREEFDDTTKLYRNVFGFFIHHAIADGRSCVTLLQQTAANLNAIVNDAVPNLTDTSSFSLMPSNSELLNHIIGWSNFQKLFLFPQMYSAVLRLALYVQSLRTTKNSVLAGFPCMDQEKVRSLRSVTRMLRRVVLAADMTKLVDRCRSEDITFTAAISAACHIAFCNLLADNPVHSNATIDMVMATSTRQHHSPKLPEEYIGNYVGAMNYNIPLARKPSDIWQTAKHCKESINGIVQQGKQFSFASVVEVAGKDLLKHIDKQSELEPQKRVSSLHSVSNVGQVVQKMKENDAFHLDDVWLAAASHKMFGTFSNYLLTFNGRLNWLTCYDAKYISKETAQHYFDLAWQILKQSLT